MVSQLFEFHLDAGGCAQMLKFTNTSGSSLGLINFYQITYSAMPQLVPMSTNDASVIIKTTHKDTSNQKPTTKKIPPQIPPKQKT